VIVGAYPDLRPFEIKGLLKSLAVGREFPEADGAA
jgi:hypothetical protein